LGGVIGGLKKNNYLGTRIQGKIKTRREKGEG